mgnify:CR=1 FL=1
MVDKGKTFECLPKLGKSFWRQSGKGDGGPLADGIWPDTRSPGLNNLYLAGCAAPRTILMPRAGSSFGSRPRGRGKGRRRFFR